LFPWLVEENDTSLCDCIEGIFGKVIGLLSPDGIETEFILCLGLTGFLPRWQWRSQISSGFVFSLYRLFITFYLSVPFFVDPRPSSILEENDSCFALSCSSVKLSWFHIMLQLKYSYTSLLGP